MCGTTCLYFAAPEPPFLGPYLALNGCRPAAHGGPINSLLCPSNLSAAYAPHGSALVSVNCFGTDTEPDLLEAQVRRQLTDWYGEAAGSAVIEALVPGDGSAKTISC